VAWDSLVFSQRWSYLLEALSSARCAWMTGRLPLTCMLRQSLHGMLTGPSEHTSRERDTMHCEHELHDKVVIAELTVQI